MPYGAVLQQRCRQEARHTASVPAAAAAAVRPSNFGEARETAAMQAGDWTYSKCAGSCSSCSKALKLWGGSLDSSDAGRRLDIQQVCRQLQQLQ
jgi:hypothetical protein